MLISVLNVFVFLRRSKALNELTEPTFQVRNCHYKVLSIIY